MRAARRKLYRALARSPFLSRLALHVRNEAALFVGYHYADGYTDEAVVRLLAHVGPGVRAFADVGANVGRWTEHLLAHAPPGARGLLFEPSASAMARLKESLGARDGLAFVEAAVSDRAGEATFYEEAEAGEGSSFLSAHVTGEVTPRTVPVVTLDAALAERGWERLDLLKVDAEGYDLHVLRGAEGLLAGGRVRLAQFEYNRHWADAGSTLGAALRLLRGHGYEVFLLRTDGLYELDYARHGEFFSYTNFVAVAPGERGAVAPLLRGRF